MENPDRTPAPMRTPIGYQFIDQMMNLLDDINDQDIEERTRAEYAEIQRAIMQRVRPPPSNTN